MKKNQLELLVALQDLDLMRKELDDVQKLGFEVRSEGPETLEKAREELIQKIEKPLLGKYERLRARYKRAIVPVKDDTCLGCFMKLPTYLITLKNKHNQIITCEGCGRILYWLE
ncbi:MAG: hypothetical protein D6814_04470 [Calditrichaeota bacterium]|nr:MAG: hypothetical protein D6814_04470 [Calditrichota bacterium]